MAHSTDEKKLKYRNEVTVMRNDTIILPIDLYYSTDRGKKQRSEGFACAGLFLVQALTY